MRSRFDRVNYVTAITWDASHDLVNQKKSRRVKKFRFEKPLKYAPYRLKALDFLLPLGS